MYVIYMSQHVMLDCVLHYIGEGSSPYIYIHRTHNIHLQFGLHQVKNVPVLYTTERTMYSPVTSGRSENSEDIQ